MDITQLSSEITGPSSLRKLVNFNWNTIYIGDLVLERDGYIDELSGSSTSRIFFPMDLK